MNWAYAYFGCQPPNAERDGFLLGGPTMMIQLININKQNHNMSHVQHIHWSISHWRAQPLTINPKPNHCSNGCCILQGAAGDPCRAPHARDKRHARIRAEANARTWALGCWVQGNKHGNTWGFPANIGVCVGNYAMFVSIMFPPNLDFVSDSFDEFDVFWGWLPGFIYLSPPDQRLITKIIWLKTKEI